MAWSCGFSLRTASRSPGYRNEKVTERDRGGARRPPTDRRLVTRFPALVMEPNLMTTIGSMPTEWRRFTGAAVEKPCTLPGLVAVGRLPYFANPVAAIEPPFAGLGTRETEFLPSITERRVLENAAPTSDGCQRRGEASAIVPWLIVLAAPTGEIDMREPRPKLAGRMGHHRPRPGIGTSVAGSIPGLDSRHAEVAAIRGNEQRGNLPCRQCRCP